MTSKCDLGNGEFDHDWRRVSDWYGDPGVYGGTADCSFLRCQVCGEEKDLPFGWSDSREDI